MAISNCYYSPTSENSQPLGECYTRSKNNFYATSEDGIWNLSVAYREERIKIIKQLVQEL